MAISESIIHRDSEVMAVSTNLGPPRLDLSLTRGRRGTFSSFGSDGERGFSPRPARSSNDLFAQALSRIDTADSDSEWGAVRARARENNDRQGLGDLIEFFRTNSPPPQRSEQRSVFEHDEPQDDEEEPERWRLFKKLRRPRTRARSESPARRPRTAGLPNSAVASKTASGNSHIAISIPLEYCHVGPDSDWALAIFNATPPLPPTPARGSEDTLNGQVRPYASERTVTVLKTVSEKGSLSTLNTMNTMSTKSQRCKGVKGNVSIWPKVNPNPLSPPRTPYSTPPGSLRGKPSVSKPKRERLPLPPPQYAELPASPVVMPQTPSENIDRECWISESLSQSASPHHPKPKSKSPRRPQNIVLPPRRSSIKIVRPKTDTARDKPSIDGLIGGGTKRQSVAFDGPQLSPGYSEVPSLSPSIATTELSEPVISRARPARAYSTASVVLQDSESMTPRQSFTTRPGSSDTNQTTLVNGSIASRNPSTRTAASRQSRRDRVKSLKHRDMEALRALKQLQQEDDGEITPRPQTTETVISNLRLPSRDGTFGRNFRGMETKLSATNLANMAKKDQTSSTTDSNGKISDWQATQQAETPGWETAQEELTPGWETAREETPTPDWLSTSLLNDTMAAADSAASNFDNSLFRDSTSSSEPPRRWGSYHRGSWASSVPLLDRIGSFAPSDADAAQVGQAVEDGSSPPRPARMSRADSATLSQVDSARLTSPPLSIVDAEVDLPRSSTEQFIAGSIAAFPKPGSGPRLSAIMPVAEVVPTGPMDERWSASTLNSPITVVEVSHPPFPSSQTTVAAQPYTSTQLARPHTAGNTNPELFNTARGSADLQRRRQPAADEGDAAETATLRPKSRARADVDEAPVDLLSMSARELRNHYASLRSARVNDLAHEMLLNQERLEMRMHQQEQNQMLFIDRLERCMHELRSLPGSPFLTSPPLDWPLDDDHDFVYEEHRISRDARQEIRVRRTGRLQSRSSHHQHHQSESQPRRRLADNRDDFLDFDGAFIDNHDRDRRPRRPSTSHNASSRRSGAPRARRHGAPVLPPLITRGGLDSLDPLIRELQFAARVSQETNRTERIRTPQPGGPNEYYYNMI
ncbi:hypothetical protein CGLO_16975 [Colletotrichum gloeosporioides Cg-14]|uniref:Uncharacterized protein n=1 Tax=Colletotrichum gloeosporioides (strain Cg-14) TaxID=1237896 RepID=T0L7J6_COLGC|nr:hypothetical protein CGLO_16975 [Colletotrichum gloeosporioides Cg-14]